MEQQFFSQFMQLDSVLMSSAGFRRRKKQVAEQFQKSVPLQVRSTFANPKVPACFTVMLHVRNCVILTIHDQRVKTKACISFGCPDVGSRVQKVPTAYPCSVRCAHRIIGFGMWIAREKNVLCQATLRLLCEDLCGFLMRCT